MVSIIVVNWNGLEHLQTCLSALCRQTYQAFEVVFVDNGSTDGSVDYVQAKFPIVKIVCLSENLGFCGGNNIGIRQSKGEYVALINNDTEADPNWLAESINALEQNSRAGFTATRIRLFDRRTHIDTAGDYYFRTGYPGKRGWLMPDGSGYGQPEWIFGACAGAAVYRRTMLEEIGLFDEDFFNLMEDTDLSFRAQLMGYRCLYVPSAIVYHKVGATAGRDSIQRQYWSHRNHWYTLIKNLPMSLWPRYMGQILAAEALVLGSAARRGRFLVFLKARSRVLQQFSVFLEKRRVIQRLCRVSPEYIDELIRKDWFSFRRAVKRREAEYRQTE